MFPEDLPVRAMLEKTLTRAEGRRRGPERVRTLRSEESTANRPPGGSGLSKLRVGPERLHRHRVFGERGTDGPGNDCALRPRLIWVLIYIQFLVEGSLPFCVFFS